ncbi:MAG: 30S ribosomal protein S12 methylthiotransferase RimO [Deltaproteobacteria bacterium]|nr:30S ribosomal protein S12 methylthiotransferase RimO [Deltaproteobacteria bacterium]
MSSLLKITSESGESSCAPNSRMINIEPSSIVPDKFLGRAAVITLGCAKNRVDSEVMLGSLVRKGFEIVTDPSEAEIVIVNTCSFLESSVKESVDAILEVAELKEKGRCRQIFVAGCLVERYKEELKESLPEVDKFISIDDISHVGDAASSSFESIIERAARPYFLYDDTLPRYLSTKQHTAYVKISEGCNRPCTFCIIPKLRGAMRSREISSVVKEIEDLAKSGVKEVNLIAQDLTSYGLDRKGPRLAELLRAIDASSAMPWVRLLYAYPVGTDEELIRTISELPSITEYYDIPLQHSSESVLKAMKRPIGKFSARKIVNLIKSTSPDIHIRTTFIVGFPGETEKDIQDLEDFVKQGYFTNLGVFKYSPEPGTEAFNLPGQVSEEEKEARYSRIMLAQQQVVTEHLQQYLGSSLEVLIEGTHQDTDLLLSARTRFQAPEIDGEIIINDIAEQCQGVTVGALGEVEVTEIAGYDMVGTLKKIIKR